MRRRGFLLGLLLAPVGAAQAAMGDASGLSAGAESAAEPVQYGYGPPPRRGRRRGPRCRLVRQPVPVRDRWGRVVGERWVTREVCRW
ncbi:hypothetical protein ACI6QG_09260 [Roseococcus sp. DSY-14]|uniref:hypothetical protein n=1 Tax=Roseococcus sp. DSY-14 TaxID=3369650 RepID=UPI00387AC950